MARPGGWDNQRWGHLYWDADCAILPCSMLVINSSLYAIMAGTTAKPLEYFADITYGSGTALPDVVEIDVSRGVDNLAGECNITFLTTAQSSATLISGATLTVVAGVRGAGFTAQQQIFTGQIERVTWPTTGQIRATIRAFDAGKALSEASCNAGTIIGDAVSWIVNRCAQLSLGTGFQVVPRTAGITLTNEHYLSYWSFGDAIKAVVRGFKVHHAYVTGLNELVILDPTTLAAEPALFTLTSAGIHEFRPVDHDERYNRVPYSNYSGYSKNFVTYQVSVQPDGSSSIQGVEIAGNGFISGVYNDAADQATRGVMTHPGVQNNICATEAELISYATSVASESQREVTRVTVPCNPFLDVGSVLTFDSVDRWVAKIRHKLTAGALCKTELELRAE